MSSGCKCGSSCKCGDNCSCEMNYAEATETVIMGVGPAKVQLESLEMGFTAENGCKCGSNCTCDPCNCK